ncbi:MAG TPA: SCO family protein [Pyrinomonadaceae bacterium]|nr:SCO family protein [Pyrinomonadaceae bacterium]
MNSEKRITKRSVFTLSAFRLSRAALGAALFVFSFSLFANGQRVEHYNSPLYSPKYYDPAASEPNGMPAALKEVGIEQKLGTQLPLDTVVKDEDGKLVKLGDYFNTGRPVVLTFVYYECPMLCNQVLNGLTGALKGVTMSAGRDFDVVAISFDARENEKPDLAKNKKANYLGHYNRPGTDQGWHFLTASQESIDAVTQAAGFHYKWDDKSEQFAHAAAVMIVTPDGKMSRYLYGIDYAPRDIKFGVMESSKERIGNPADQLLLYCYHYDPASGKYGFAILNAMRLGGIATLLGMGMMAFVFWRRNKRKELDSEQRTLDGNEASAEDGPPATDN